MGVVEAKEPQKPLRLWPGVVIVLLQWVARFGAASLSPDFTRTGCWPGSPGGWRSSAGGCSSAGRAGTSVSAYSY